MAAGLEDVEVADQVGLDVGLGMGQRITHPGLRREMDDAVEIRVRPENLGQRFGRGDIGAHETEAGPGLQALDPRLFERRIVIVVEIIDTDDLVAACEQTFGHVVTDETGGAGNQKFQSRRILTEIAEGDRQNIYVRA